LQKRHKFLACDPNIVALLLMHDIELNPGEVDYWTRPVLEDAEQLREVLKIRMGTGKKHPTHWKGGSPPYASLQAWKHDLYITYDALVNQHHVGIEEVNTMMKAATAGHEDRAKC